MKESIRRKEVLLRKGASSRAECALRSDVDRYVSANGAFLTPFLLQMEEARMYVDALFQQIGRMGVEAVLELSAQSVVGSAKHPGKRGGEIVRHGTQRGVIALEQRKLSVDRPRLRAKGVGRGGEIEIPAYLAMQNDSRMEGRIIDTLMRGVSTRNYEELLTEMAGTAGVSKSSISRKYIVASAKKIQELMERRFDDVNLLIVYIDGLIFAGHHVLMAVGVDEKGQKHALGFRQGSAENATVATELLQDIAGRGVSPDRKRLFVIDGSKALRKAINAVFGEDNPVQRCRLHKIRNVVDHLPKDMRDQVKRVMRAAFKLPYKEGLARLRQQASWLEQSHPSAAESLREGLDEMFTINKLDLSPSLLRCLASTNIIESPNSGIRQKTRRVTNWKGGQMVSRWAATALLATEKNFRKIMGYKDLWMLEASLNAISSAENFDTMRKVA